MQSNSNNDYGTLIYVEINLLNPKCYRIFHRQYSNCGKLNPTCSALDRQTTLDPSFFLTLFLSFFLSFLSFSFLFSSFKITQVVVTAASAHMRRLDIVLLLFFHYITKFFFSPSQFFFTTLQNISVFTLHSIVLSHVFSNCKVGSEYFVEHFCSLVHLRHYETCDTFCDIYHQFVIGFWKHLKMKNCNFT